MDQDATWYGGIGLGIGDILHNSTGNPIITGSIARSATRRYLIYSEADFEVSRPAGATRCTDWGEIWRGGRDFRYRSPKTEILLRFYQNVEYKRPTGAYPLRDFQKNCRVCTPFQYELAVKISLDLLKGLYGVMGVLS